MLTNLEAEIFRLQGVVYRLRSALGQYADDENWTSDGNTWIGTPEGIDVAIIALKHEK